MLNVIRCDGEKHGAARTEDQTITKKEGAKKMEREWQHLKAKVAEDSIRLSNPTSELASDQRHSSLAPYWNVRGNARLGLRLGSEHLTKHPTRPPTYVLSPGQILRNNIRPILRQVGTSDMLVCLTIGEMSFVPLAHM